MNDPFVDEDGNFLVNEHVVSEVDDDLAIDDEEYHDTPIDFGEARDLMCCSTHLDDSICFGLLFLVLHLMKLMLQFWWSPKVVVCFVALQPPRLEASKVQRLCSPRLLTMIQDSQMMILVVADHTIFGDGASSTATPLSRLLVRNEALGDSLALVHLFSDRPKPTQLMLVMGFLKEQNCAVDYGEYLIQFLMQSRCWWPLFVSSRGVVPCHCVVILGLLSEAQ